MSISLDNTTLGTEQSNVKTILNTIDDGLIKATLEIANTNLNQLVSTVDTMWIGVTADEFKKKVINDKDTFVKIMSSLSDRMHEDITQMSANVANADALVASHMGEGGVGGGSYNNGLSFASTSAKGAFETFLSNHQSENDILNSLNDNSQDDDFGWDDFATGAGRVGATIGTGVTSLVEGVGEFGEALVDCGAILGTALNTPVSGLIDAGQAIYGAATGNEWESVTKSMWGDTMGFVSNKYVESAFDSFYDDTLVGQTLKDYSYGFDTTRGIGSGVGYTAGVVALSVATLGAGGVAVGAGSAGASAGAGTLATTMAGVGAVSGVGRGTETAWADGAGLGEGLAYGAANGAWEGAQFYAGGAINGLAPFTSNGLNIATRVGLDAADAGLEGVVQPGMKTIYSDKEYGELFDEAGGWKNVGTQAAMGAALSGVGEATGLAKKFRETSSVLDESNGVRTEQPLSIIDDNKVERNISPAIDDSIKYNKLAGPDVGFNETVDALGTKFGDIGPKVNELMSQKNLTVDEILARFEKNGNNVQKEALENFCKTTKQGEFLSRLTSDEIKVTNQYSRMDYKDINKALAESSGSLNGASEKVIGQVKQLDSMISKYGGLDENMVLYRAVTEKEFTRSSFPYKDVFEGINTSDTKQMYAALKSLEGASLDQYGYLSTSPGYNTSFAKYDGYNIVYAIEAPEGTRGAYINQISSCYNMENEYLVDRGYSLKIKEVSPPVVDAEQREKIIIRCELTDIVKGAGE